MEGISFHYLIIKMILLFFSVGCVLSHMCILTLCTELAIPLHVLGILHTHGKAVFRADRRMEILYLI